MIPRTTHTRQDLIAHLGGHAPRDVQALVDLIAGAQARPVERRRHHHKAARREGGQR
jgi:hypothetical protein